MEKTIGDWLLGEKQKLEKSLADRAISIRQIREQLKGGLYWQENEGERLAWIVYQLDLLSVGQAQLPLDRKPILLDKEGQGRED